MVEVPAGLVSAEASLLHSQRATVPCVFTWSTLGAYLRPNLPFFLRTPLILD